MFSNARRHRPGASPCLRTALAVAAGCAATALLPVASQALHCDVREFELTISLEASPQAGDEQERYEEIIEDFAEAVYEATKCQHRIDRVNVWRNSEAHDRADIIWETRDVPMSSPNGVDQPGLRMYMTDHFVRPDPNGEGSGNDVPLVLDRRAPAKTAGAMLAHEWGHYAYGLRDEHEILEDDVAVVPSLMNSPWTAAQDESDDLTGEWVNFSIPGPSDGLGTGPSENTGATAQHRTFGRSGWEVLSDEEVSLAELLTSPLPGVSQRTAQALDAPDGLPSDLDAGGTDAPEIVWHDACAEYVIAIDNSGSTSGAVLARAKEVATTLVGGMEPDATWLTVLSFHNEAVLRHGPQLVSDEPDDEEEAMTERDRFLEAIDQIASLQEATRFSSGLDEALDALDFPGTCDTSDVTTASLFFVSDGGNSEEEAEGDLVDVALLTYETQGVQILTLNVGTEDAPDLIPLASETDGVAFGPLATTREAWDALDEAESKLGIPHPVVEEGVLMVEAETEVSAPLPVDSTFGRLRVCASAPEAVEIMFRSPGGILLPPTRFPEPGDEPDPCETFFATTAPGSGTWEVVATAGEDDPDDGFDPPYLVTYDAVATTFGATYTLDAWVANAKEGAVQAPEPILVLASLWNGRPIYGARVEMSVDGAPEVPLRDDGLPPDEIADDGLYVGAALYDLADVAECEGDPDLCPKIQIRATNPFGGATFTSNGLLVGPDKTVPGVPRTDTLVGEDFERTVELQVTTLAAPVPLPLVGLTPLAGRIASFGGAPDRFEVDVCDGSDTVPDPLEVRVTGALLGMVPHLEVFLTDPGSNPDPIPHVAATAEDRAAGVAATVAAAELSCDVNIFAEVSHATGGTGTYQISAGPVLDLTFGIAGPGDSPCEIMRLDQERALFELERGSDGLTPARLLLSGSRRATLEDLRAALQELPNATDDENQSSKLLKKSAKRSRKAEKLIAKAEKKPAKTAAKEAKRIAKIESRIRTLGEALEDACALLPDGGALLLAGSD